MARTSRGVGGTRIRGGVIAAGVAVALAVGGRGHAGVAPAPARRHATVLKVAIDANGCATGLSYVFDQGTAEPACDADKLCAYVVKGKAVKLLASATGPYRKFVLRFSGQPVSPFGDALVVEVDGESSPVVTGDHDRRYRFALEPALALPNRDKCPKPDPQLIPD